MTEEHNILVQKVEQYRSENNTQRYPEIQMAHFISENTSWINKFHVDTLIKHYELDRIALTLEIRRILGRENIFSLNLVNLTHYWDHFVIVQNKNTKEFSIRNTKFIRGHEKKFTQVGTTIYKEVNELLSDLYAYKYEGKEVPVDTTEWPYYAIQAGYNPECDLPWVEVKKFKNNIEASKESEEHSNGMGIDPIRLSNDYYRSIGMLVAKHSYPKYAIKNLNV